FVCSVFCFLHSAPPSELYPLSLHDALPISLALARGQQALGQRGRGLGADAGAAAFSRPLARRPSVLACGHSSSSSRANRSRSLRSEEHTSELQSRVDLVCRLLLEKKK